MFERVYDILDFIFPVYIVNRDEILVIEDRRPTRGMFLSITCLLTILALVMWAWFSRSFIADGLTITVVVAAVAATLFFCIRGTFREVYVFDRSKDTYTFTRQSILKRDVIEGAASQFRAAEVLKEEIPGDYEYDTTYRYHAALLQNTDLLFGTDEIQKLRQDRPMYNRSQTEARIVAAVTKFLNITNNGTVDSVYRPSF